MYACAKFVSTPALVSYLTPVILSWFNLAQPLSVSLGPSAELEAGW